jgi:Helix-turn-helix domain
MIFKQASHMSSNEACQYLRVSRSTLYRLVKARLIYSLAEFTDTKRLQFDKQNLDWFIMKKEQEFRAKHCTERQKYRASVFDQGLRLYETTGDDSHMVRCIHHPERMANRSGYVFQRRRTCGSCKTNRRKDGTPRPAHQRNVSARSYRKSMERRSRFLGRMRGWRLIDRLFGRGFSKSLGLDVKSPV